MEKYTFTSRTQWQKKNSKITKTKGTKMTGIYNEVMQILAKAADEAMASDNPNRSELASRINGFASRILNPDHVTNFFYCRTISSAVAVEIKEMMVDVVLDRDLWDILKLAYHTIEEDYFIVANLAEDLYYLKLNYSKIGESETAESIMRYADRVYESANSAESRLMGKPYAKNYGIAAHNIYIDCSRMHSAYQASLQEGE